MLPRDLRCSNKAQGGSKEESGLSDPELRSHLKGELVVIDQSAQ